MELENLKVCTEMQNIAIRASERIEEEAKAYEARIKELESDNLKKTRQIENGMRCTKNLEARIKELEADITIRERDIQRIEKMNVELVAENNILKSRIKGLEFRNEILTNRLKFEKERKPKWISVKDRFPKTNKDVYCDDGRVHFHTSYGWSDQEQHFYWLDCELPTTEKSTAVEEG